MRIGIDARFYGTLGKGLGRYTAKLIQHLEIVDTENEYVVFLRRENYADYIPGSPRFRKVLADYRWYGWEEQLRFPQILADHELDLVHFPHFNVPLLYRGRFVVTIHDLILFHFPTPRGSTLLAPLYWLKYLVYRGVIASAVRRAALVITVSRFTADDIRSRFPSAKGKIRVTFEAVEKTCEYVEPGQCTAVLRACGLIGKTGGVKRFCLYVGNAYPHKNLESVLAVAPRFPDIHFVFVGREDYFLSRLKRMAANDGLHNVYFIGEKSDRELSALYRAAELYLFPSLYEGFGLPPLEAFSYGLPVLAARRGALPEIIGTAATFYDPSLEEEFGTALKRLLSGRKSPAPSSGMCAVLARYDWRDMARQTAKLYHVANGNT